MAKRKGRTVEVWMGWDQEAKFIPSAWGSSERECTATFGYVGWPDLEAVRVRIVEVLPKSKKSKRAKGTR